MYFTLSQNSYTPGDVSRVDGGRGEDVADADRVEGGLGHSRRLDRRVGRMNLTHAIHEGFLVHFAPHPTVDTHRHCQDSQHVEPILNLIAT